MANGSPFLEGYSRRNPAFGDLYSKLISLRQTLPEETLRALKEREREGYRPVSVEEKYIDVEDEETFDKYKRLFGQIPSDPSRNRLIAELGYKPVLRYRSKQLVKKPVEVQEPKEEYELGFSTMPDKKMKLASRQEFDEASLIRDIDENLAGVFQKRFDVTGLNRQDALKSLQTANPEQYRKMFLTEQERNAAIMNYAKAKGIDPQSTLSTYVQSRSKYYPRELVVGQGVKEQSGTGAAETLYGYRNYLTTLLPSAVTTQVQTTKEMEVPEEKIATYPFRFGYKVDGNGSRPKTKPGRPDGPSEECPGGICEKLGERMARRNKYLFKKSKGGILNVLNKKV